MERSAAGYSGFEKEFLRTSANDATVEVLSSI